MTQTPDIDLDPDLHHPLTVPLPRWQRLLVAVGLLLPLVVLVLVRAWLHFPLRGAAGGLPPELALASEPDAFLSNLATVAGGLVVAGLLVWWLLGSRVRWVIRTTLWSLLLGWVLLWTAGTVQMVRSHLNQVGLKPSHSETLRVVAVRLEKPTVRGPGGARVYLDWPAQGGLHTTLIENPGEALLRQPERLTVEVAPGRWRGWFVVGWSLPDVARALPAAGSPLGVSRTLP